MTDDTGTSFETEHTFVHIDDFDEDEHIEPGLKPHIYAFESEDRRVDLIDIGHDLKSRFILPMLVVWPNDYHGKIEDANTGRLRALEWAMSTSSYPIDNPEILSDMADDGTQHTRRE